MENKVEIRVFLYCPCCNRNVDETSLWIDKEFKGRVGRLPTNLPCIDCWNREMGIFGNAVEKEEKTETQKILEQDEKDMHEGEEGEEEQSEDEEETNEETEEDTDLEEDE